MFAKPPYRKMWASQWCDSYVLSVFAYSHKLFLFWCLIKAKCNIWFTVFVLIFVCFTSKAECLFSCLLSQPACSWMKTPVHSVCYNKASSSSSSSSNHGVSPRHDSHTQTLTSGTALSSLLLSIHILSQPPEDAVRKSPPRGEGGVTVCVFLYTHVENNETAETMKRWVWRGCGSSGDLIRIYVKKEDLDILKTELQLLMLVSFSFLSSVPVFSLFFFSLFFSFYIYANFCPFQSSFSLGFSKLYSFISSCFISQELLFSSPSWFSFFSFLCLFFSPLLFSLLMFSFLLFFSYVLLLFFPVLSFLFSPIVPSYYSFYSFMAFSLLSFPFIFEWSSSNKNIEKQ